MIAALPGFLALRQLALELTSSEDHDAKLSKSAIDNASATILLLQFSGPTSYTKLCGAHGCVTPLSTFLSLSLVEMDVLRVVAETEKIWRNKGLARVEKKQ